MIGQAICASLQSFYVQGTVCTNYVQVFPHRPLDLTLLCVAPPHPALQREASDVCGDSTYEVAVETLRQEIEKITE